MKLQNVVLRLPHRYDGKKTDLLAPLLDCLITRPSIKYLNVHVLERHLDIKYSSKTCKGISEDNLLLQIGGPELQFPCCVQVTISE